MTEDKATKAEERAALKAALAHAAEKDRRKENGYDGRLADLFEEARRGNEPAHEHRADRRHDDE